MRLLTLICAALPLLALSACATTMQASPTQATATLHNAQGSELGQVTARVTAAGLQIDLAAQGLIPGLHGVHVHRTGACTPDFAAAGGHWNPASTLHGMHGDDGQHAGDMPNLVVGADGTGRLTYLLAGGADFAGLMDADGSAFIIHAGEDDQMTDPAGNSGDRIACGVFAAD
jgi:Cu-Zn family superoxide dismutase